VLGALPGVIGTMQAMETIKILSGYGRSLAGRMLHYDATETRVREIVLRPNPDCALCGPVASIVKPVVYEAGCGGRRGVKEIDVLETRRRLQNGFDGILLDVRERDEYAWAHLEGSRLIPLSEFAARLDELPREQPYLVYCKAGQRSAHAAAMMLEAGFADVTNVRGGILAWLEEAGEVVSG
jgi:adenylyltransferase/sulfurtransferase